MQEPDDFPAVPWRRRLLIVLAAVATASTILLTMLYPPSGLPRKVPVGPPDAARCAPGQTQDCVGGMASVIVAPSPASAPR